jgi:hypothetical protein
MDEWKAESLEECMVACKKESLMVGPEIDPPFKNEPTPLKKFFEHLEKNGKARFKMVSHKLELNDIGKVVGIKPDEVTCLPWPTQAPKKKKTGNVLDNVAGFVDIDCVSTASCARCAAGTSTLNTIIPTQHTQHTHPCI